MCHFQLVILSLIPSCESGFLQVCFLLVLCICQVNTYKGIVFVHIFNDV